MAAGARIVLIAGCDYDRSRGAEMGCCRSPAWPGVVATAGRGVMQRRGCCAKAGLKGLANLFQCAADERIAIMSNLFVLVTTYVYKVFPEPTALWR